MLISISADSANSKNIPTLLQEMGYSIPCNCHGAHLCNGARYPFDCAYIPKSPLTIDWNPQSNAIHGLSLETLSPEDGQGDTMLIDIGTTTIAFALISRMSGKLRQRSAIENPQRRFGADVIARISASCGGKSQELQSILIQAIQSETTRLCNNNKQKKEDITSCYIGGNTTMIHLLMGYDCAPLSHSPFIVERHTPDSFIYQQCNVFISPWLSAFVGGDICAGLYACHMWETEATAILLDLGTNGEIVLSHNGVQYVPSTAAGPAFEGGNLHCGCASVAGAISQVVLRRLQPKLTTIDNKLPIGLCGSGAISVCAELLRKGFVTKDGVFTEQFPAEGLLLSLSAAGAKIVFTKDDFRNIQLAVAAIAAGIDTLLHEAGITSSDVSSLFLGGGFGFHIAAKDCRTLGLFSSLDYEAIQPLGNCCLQGLFRMATEQLPLSIPRPVVPVNLAEHDYFQKQFLAHMHFPDSQ